MSDGGERIFVSEEDKINSAYMSRLFCSTKERIGYILMSTVGALGLGKYDTGQDIFLYKLYGLTPFRYAKASSTLVVYDMLNDPLTAFIVDNARTRWGKFKPFQVIALLPNLFLGFCTCMLPFIAQMFGFEETGRLWTLMALSYAGETVGALTGGGGGYINNVFTPNPNERTSILVSAKFIKEFFAKFPEQLMGIILDVFFKGVISSGVTKMYVIFKTVLWTITSCANIYWVIVSKERVAQSKKPPNPLHSVKAVFQNRPLLVYTLSNMIDGINIGTSESLYYSDVLHFNLLPTIGGIAGSPVSYISYPLATKFRRKFSTKALWLMQSGSIFTSEFLFFLVGCIGGKEKGLYLRKVPMTIAFSIGNVIEMVFYATKQIVNDEINYEVLDYCEWKKGYRVEATISMISGYFSKVENIILKLVNGWLLENWAGFQSGVDVEQTAETKWRMFVTAHGPHLIFDIISLAPMFLYNIDKKTREKMYDDLEHTRALTAAREKRMTDEKTEAE